MIMEGRNPAPQPLYIRDYTLLACIDPEVQRETWSDDSRFDILEDTESLTSTEVFDTGR